MTDETPHPDQEEVPDRLSWDDFYAAAIEEVERAQITAKGLRTRAGEEKIKSNRPSWLKAAAAQDRKARIFEKIAKLIDRVSTDHVLGNRLAELRREEMAADRDGRDDGSNNQGDDE